MNRRGRATVIAAVTGLAMAGAAAAAPQASARGYGHDPTRVVASDLGDPYGLQALPGGGFLVAENSAGQVTRVDADGQHHVLIEGAGGVAGVASAFGTVFAVTGGPNEDGSPPAGNYAPSSVLRSDDQGHHVKVIADLGKYELEHNPDGQVQFVNGVPVDALSNPFSMNLSRYGLLVADGGANDVLRVNPFTGHVSTFFVPPTVKDVPACLAPGAQANPGTIGCDPVPTGIAVANGSVYVSTLGAEVPGAGRVYRLDPWTGRVLHVWKGLTAPTGIAVRSDGTIYVSEVLYGAPADDGPPPADFDPSTVGRITRISDGEITHAQVTMPTGLDLRRGRLYASAWSVAALFGVDHPGQIVRVHDRAFS